MISIPTLHTPNLTLRPFVPQDAKALHEIEQGEDVLRYFPNPAPPPLEQVERFIASQKPHWEQHGCGNWAVVLTASGEFTGWAGLQYLPGTGEIEVGYLFDRSHWGQGYATQAARASLQFGFERLGMRQIIALVHPDNLASLRVAAKCGLAAVECKTYWGLELVRHTVTAATLILS